MVSYWIGKYFNQRTYYMINGKPVIFVFSYTQLNQNAKLFGQMGQLLLGRAQAKAREKGYKGIYFVAVTNAVPSDGLENGLRDYGYSAYSGWNYVVSEDSSKVTDYNSMVDTYLDYYDAASKTAKNLPYIVPASPGWDSRPWYGNSALVRTDPTPEKFERMLFGAKYLMDNTEKIPKILMIEAWNEFGEGSYIEPTKKWGFKYLETIQKIFTSAPSRVKRK
jgi:hypothetical protein